MDTNTLAQLIYANVVAMRFHPKNDGGKKIPYKELAAESIKAAQTFDLEKKQCPHG